MRPAPCRSITSFEVMFEVMPIEEGQMSCALLPVGFVLSSVKRFDMAS